MKLLSLVACASAFDQKLCFTCKHYIKTNTYGKCRLFPLIAYLNDDIVYGYDYVICTTARTFTFMCGNGNKYEKIDSDINQEKIDKNASN